MSEEEILGTILYKLREKMEKATDSLCESNSKTHISYYDGVTKGLANAIEIVSEMLEK